LVEHAPGSRGAGGGRSACCRRRLHLRRVLTFVARADSCKPRVVVAVRPDAVVDASLCRAGILGTRIECGPHVIGTREFQCADHANSYVDSDSDADADREVDAEGGAAGTKTEARSEANAETDSDGRPASAAERLARAR
jgi:hypothetical protein